MVLDCRFLVNPFWEADLRALDGRDLKVARYVETDPRFQTFLDQTLGLLRFLLPEYVAERQNSFHAWVRLHRRATPVGSVGGNTGEGPCG